MYKHHYAEILADRAADARGVERRALDRAVALLERAAAMDEGSPEEVEALDYVTQLWSVFIADLASPGNDLPDRLRASLMSIGLGIMAEVQRVSLGQSRDLAGLADICAIVRDGLE